ncbi:hypothetical protein BY996DRAFT_7900366 [Phakopsora pachyrhizi]|nr:hypothetical protein BY996DRAFT_7900366 [Phakopsora pachyrhizi]
MNPKSNSIKKILILVGLILAACQAVLGHADLIAVAKILCQHGTGTGMKCGNSFKELCENKIRPAFCSQLHRSSNCPRNCPSR